MRHTRRPWRGVKMLPRGSELPREKRFALLALEETQDARGPLSIEVFAAQFCCDAVRAIPWEYLATGAAATGEVESTRALVVRLMERPEDYDSPFTFYYILALRGLAKYAPRMRRCCVTSMGEFAQQRHRFKEFMAQIGASRVPVHMCMLGMLETIEEMFEACAPLDTLQANALSAHLRDVLSVPLTIDSSCIDLVSHEQPDTAPKHFTAIPKIADPTVRQQWYDAHYEEIDGLFTSGTIKMVPLPKHIPESSLKPLLTLYYKEKSDGRKKARTVLGCPKGSLDPSSYGRTFSPTGRPTTFRLLMSLAALLGAVVKFGDVKQAYGQAEWPANLAKVLARIPMGYKRFYNGVPHCIEAGNLY